MSQYVDFLPVITTRPVYQTCPETLRPPVYIILGQRCFSAPPIVGSFTGFLACHPFYRSAGPAIELLLVTHLSGKVNVKPLNELSTHWHAHHGEQTNEHGQKKAEDMRSTGPWHIWGSTPTHHILEEVHASAVSMQPVVCPAFLLHQRSDKKEAKTRWRV